ncbi:MAG TPA: DUF5684 domain-containing protein [Dermatophilaceae bacterium]|jgi:hypothetical protein
MNVVYAALILLTLVSLWLVYKKAGHPGWAVLIPFYNLYTWIKVGDQSGWLMLLYLIPFVNYITQFVVCLGVARKFGKHWSFGVGLFFLPFVFLPILAFGSARYDHGSRLLRIPGDSDAALAREARRQMARDAG